MRVAYADPPYPGQAKRHYADHPDYGGEVDHAELARQLATFDGFVLHTSSVAQYEVETHVRAAGITDYRIMPWRKPFAAFKRNVPVAYAWEPVIVRACRKPIVTGRVVLRDWLAVLAEECSQSELDDMAESITLRRGLTGAKPERVCRWLFEVLGMEPGDELMDLFPGTGAVTRAWEAWRSELRLAV
jgi:hypothetical protein